MLKYSTEYLIIHENELNWDELSTMRDDYFSLVEVRLFRKKINWKLYFESHGENCPITTEILNIGAKYFTPSTYKILEEFNIATDDFIVQHPENFHFESIIRNCNISEDALLKTRQYWENIFNIKQIFNESKYIKLSNPKYEQIKLILEVK